MKKAFNFVKGFLSSRPYWKLLLLWPIQWIWYGVLNHAVTKETSHIIEMELDSSIPFCEYFIIPYCIWYFYIAGALLFTLWKNKKDFIHMAVIIFVGMFSSMLVCTFYPSWHVLRDVPATYEAVLSGKNIFTETVRLMWILDQPAVIFPSMHTLIGFLISLSLTFADCMKGKTWIKVICWIYSLSVAASTVFTKAHSIADVFLAVAFIIPCALLTYYVFYPKRVWSKDPAVIK